MTVGFIGLGNMGFPMARRLLDAGHHLTVFDTRAEVLDIAAGLGATPAASPTEVADRADTVLASLPSVQASADVAAAVADGSRVSHYIDLSTVGAQQAAHTHTRLAGAGIAALDCPVSGGVRGAENGTLAVMVSGSREAFETVRALLETLGRPIFIAELPGAAQTMKLANNLLAATTLAATAEAVVLGVKAGLDPSVMIEVFNAGSGATHASRDKFPRAILPRTFDFGFATGLMVKDLRLCLREAAELGLDLQVSEAVGQPWEAALADQGADSDFTTIIRPIEDAAGVIVDGRHDERNGRS
ncbi:NAD(P)-dependent oxidoreductase [Mycobacterium sp. AMU20-3851]|uniref:NAD(P)-dependent oxidoreductase n=1 Tax=Mycobacterium sp. AMU20-3851 TaxID=3122055 RepID=UPI003754334F